MKTKKEFRLFPWPDFGWFVFWYSLTHLVCPAQRQFVRRFPRKLAVSLLKSVGVIILRMANWIYLSDALCNRQARYHFAAISPGGLFNWGYLQKRYLADYDQPWLWGDRIVVYSWRRKGSLTRDWDIFLGPRTKFPSRHCFAGRDFAGCKSCTEPARCPEDQWTQGHFFVQLTYFEALAFQLVWGARLRKPVKDWTSAEIPSEMVGGEWNRVRT